MIRSLIKIGLLLVVGILCYNYFFGDSEEKAQSKEVFKQAGNMARSVGTLLRSEREKFNEGKYDGALDKLGDAYQGLKKQAKFLDENVLQRLEAAEKRREALKAELNDLQSEPETAAPPKTLKKADQKKQDEITAAKAADKKAQQEKLLKQLEDLQKEYENIANEAEKGN